MLYPLLNASDCVHWIRCRHIESLADRFVEKSQVVDLNIF